MSGGTEIDDGSYIADPLLWLKRYLREGMGVGVGRGWESAFEYGVLGMALVVVTWIRTLEALPVTTEVGRQETIVALRTMLTELDLWDLACETYEVLGEWRRVKFVET